MCHFCRLGQRFPKLTAHQNHLHSRKSERPGPSQTSGLGLHPPHSPQPGLSSISPTHCGLRAFALHSHLDEARTAPSFQAQSPHPCLAGTAAAPVCTALSSASECGGQGRGGPALAPVGTEPWRPGASVIKKSVCILTWRAVHDILSGKGNL